MKRIAAYFVLVVSLFFAATAWADATAFNPLGVTVEAKSMGGGVPVGTVISWPVATNPDDWDNWLECNGQTISAAVYPELFAIVGATVPDLQGMFLRGVGGNSAAVGVTQNDGISSSQSLQFTINATEALIDAGDGTDVQNSGGDGASTWYPAAYKGLITQAYSRISQWHNDYVPVSSTTTLTAQIHSGTPETRPINKAVRYLIRSRP